MQHLRIVFALLIQCFTIHVYEIKLLDEKIIIKSICFLHLVTQNEIMFGSTLVESPTMVCLFFSQDSLRSVIFLHSARP